MLGKKIYDVIVQLCEERDLSIVELADMCQMSRESIYNVKYRTRVKITFVIKICQALHIRTQEFFDKLEDNNN